MLSLTGSFPKEIMFSSYCSNTFKAVIFVAILLVVSHPVRACKAAITLKYEPSKISANSSNETSLVDSNFPQIIYYFLRLRIH